MYGTVARWRLQDGKQREFEELAEGMMREIPRGSRSLLVYRSDVDPREYWVASSWDSKDAYTSNSNTPEQDDRFRRLRALMESDPEWHDGEIIVSRP
jgi:heme-degrading monooxygenase HmoA